MNEPISIFSVPLSRLLVLQHLLEIAVDPQQPLHGRKCERGYLLPCNLRFNPGAALPGLHDFNNLMSGAEGKGFAYLFVTYND